jgi:2-dehydropantoate 2-reductase
LGGPPHAAERALALHQTFPKTMYASMYHDLAKGKPLELDSLSGFIVRRGRELGVATPVHEMAWLVLKPYLHGTPAALA